ncbi:hypothetical protein D3C87_1527880 [compost metagenome]
MHIEKRKKIVPVFGIFYLGIRRKQGRDFPDNRLQGRFLAQQKIGTVQPGSAHVVDLFFQLIFIQIPLHILDFTSPIRNKVTKKIKFDGGIIGQIL